MKAKEKNQKIITLGAESTPLPVWDEASGTTGALSGPASGISFHTFHEDADASSIYADLMRNLPSRSMLPHLVHELLERDPGRVDWEKHSFLCGYMGPPSIGKSYMVKTLGRLTHPRGCLYLNCKDIDMGTIFCETVFDTSVANREKASIDARILQGNQGGKGLSAASLEMLRHAFGEAYIEEQQSGKTAVRIDWNGIQVKGETPEEQNYHKQIIRETISQVCQSEGIAVASDLGQIGISTRDGIAIRGADPKSADYGRPILLDEINRAKPGTLQKLYEYFAMLSDPKVDRFQVVGGENRPFTFHRKDLPVSYRLNFTGNPSTRGMGSADMDRPLISRFGVELDIRTVPDPALHDYTDRIAQTLTGVPLTQIYYSARPYFDKNPGKLAETARLYRMTGLSEAEKKAVPAEELLNISQAEKTIRLSEQLATFFSSLQNVFDPESKVYRGGKISLSQEYESYLQGIEIDLRLVTKLIEKASVVTPKVLPPQAMDYTAIFSTAAEKSNATVIDADDRLSDRGQRLENYLQHWLHQVLVPADAQTRGVRPEECRKVLRMARTLAAHCGIGQLQLKESQPGGVLRIGELYDFDKLSIPQERHKVLRDLMVEMVRKNNPGLPSESDSILSVDDVSLAIKAAESAGSGIFAANLDPKILGKSPFIRIAANDNDDQGALVSYDAFMTALTVAELRKETLAHIWNSSSLLQSPHIDPNDEAVKIASNTSASGLAMTTVTTANGEKEQPIHIFRAPSDERGNELVMVVSASVDKRLEALLKNSGVTYINAADADSSAAVDKAVGKCANDNLAALKGHLSAAFLMRNGKPGEESLHVDKSLGELMAGKSSLASEVPVRIVKSNVKKNSQP